MLKRAWAFHELGRYPDAVNDLTSAIQMSKMTREKAGLLVLRSECYRLERPIRPGRGRFDRGSQQIHGSWVPCSVSRFGISSPRPPSNGLTPLRCFLPARRRHGSRSTALSRVTLPGPSAAIENMRKPIRCFSGISARASPRAATFTCWRSARPTWANRLKPFAHSNGPRHGATKPDLGVVEKDELLEMEIEAQSELAQAQYRPAL